MAQTKQFEPMNSVTTTCFGHHQKELTFCMMMTETNDRNIL